MVGQSTSQDNGQLCGDSGAELKADQQRTEEVFINTERTNAKQLPER